MSKFVARLLPLSILVAGAILGAANPAHAIITISKDLCGPALGSLTACVNGTGALPVVAPNTPVSYTFEIVDDGTNAQVYLVDTFPPGFVPQSTDCVSTMPAYATTMVFGPITLTPNQPKLCKVSGFFNYLPATPNNANNVASLNSQSGLSLVTSGPVNAVVAPPSRIPSNVSVIKTAQVTSQGNGTATVDYTITVTNSGPFDVYGMQLQDRVSLPATSIPLTATYQAGSGTCTRSSTLSDCYNQTPTIISPVTVPSTFPVDFLEWSYPTGSAAVLKAGDSIVVKFTAVITVPVFINCQRVNGGNQLINEAHIGFNIPGATSTTFELAPGNNTSIVPVPITFIAPINPDCGKPAIKMAKTLVPPQTIGTTFAWGSTLTYDVTLQNTSSQTITNIRLFDILHSLGDFVSGGVGTPTFSAQAVGIGCLPAICINTVPVGGLGPTQSVPGYLHAIWMLGTTIPTVAANTTVSFQLKIHYAKPECDSYPDVKQKPVFNVVRASYVDPTLGNATVKLETDPAVALFDAPEPCNFRITKKVSDGSQKIVFGQNFQYTVTYQNLNAQPATIGTMIDAMRIVQPNYASLTAHYSYTCIGPGVTGFSSVGASFPISASGTVLVSPTSQVQQGVRIIQNLVPVVFPPNGIVTCTVTVKVDTPPPSPKCARVGELENAGIMDQSVYYNPNLPWPSNTNPGFADKVSLPLPQCFNLVVNKSVKPIWTTQNGGPLSYQLLIANIGDPIIPSDGVSLTDTFAPANYVGSGVLQQCLTGTTFSANPQAGLCDFNWPIPLTSNPSTLSIQTLAHDWTAATSFLVAGPYPAPYPALPGQVCNDAGATLNGLKPEDWYPNDPSTWATRRCVPIFTISDLTVTKLLQVVAPATPPPPTSFVIDVNCTLVLNGTNYAPSQTFTFNYPPNPLSQLMTNIPVGSICTIAEHPLPATPIPNRGCPSGFGVWGPVQYPSVLDPKQKLDKLKIEASGNVLQALNTFTCVDPRTAMLKVCKVAGPGIPIGTPFTFTAGSNTFTVPAGPGPGGTCMLGPSFPTGSTVTVSETIPAGTTVSSIAVAPTNRLVGIPNLAGGSVNVIIGTGVTEVTFTDKRTGYLEICKQGEVPGTFTVNPGGLGPIVVPAGACSPAIEVESGPVVISEMPTAGIGLTACATLPANQQGACDSKAGTSTVNVSPGDISTMTIALITNGRSTGSLTVKKLVKAPDGATLPDLTGVVFPVDVACTPSGPTTTITLTPANLSQTIPVPVNSTCIVKEQSLDSTGTCGKPLISVALPPTYVPGQSVTIPPAPASATVEITDILACLPTGSLNVSKRMRPAGAAPPPIPPGVTFPVQVTCTPGGPSQIVNLTAATPSVTLSGILATNVCTLTELAPVGPIPANCKWGTPTYTPGQTATIPAQSTIERFVWNELVCEPPTGSLTVKKSVITPGIPPDLTGVGFPVTVVCTPGPTATVTLTTAAPSQVIPNIPVGASCVVTEQPPASTGTCPKPLVSAAGSTVYVPSQTVMVAAAGSTVEIQNILLCVPGVPKPCVLDAGMTEAGNLGVRRATLAQTFKPTQTGALASITHGLQSQSGTVANYTLLITTTTAAGLPTWTGGPITTPNVLLAMTGVTVFTIGPLVTGVVLIPPAQQPQLTAGTQYALILVPGTPTTGTMAWRGNANAAGYPNGSAYELNGTTWSVPASGPKDHGFRLDGLCQ